jgi:hypothetical protein
MTSEFDVALSSPLLQEPIKKKWSMAKPSWFVGGGGSSSSFSDSFSDVEEINFDKPSPSKKVKASRRHSSDTLETTPLYDCEESSDEFSCADSSSVDSVPLGTEDVYFSNPYAKSTSTSTANNVNIAGSKPIIIPLNISLEQHALDLDTAILHERNAEFADVAGSMRQIRDIQQDLALVVESQDESIQRLSWNSIEAFDKAESGMEHLVQAVGHQHGRTQTQNRVASLVVFAAVVMAVGFIASSFLTAEVVEPTSGSGGSPSFMMPQLMKVLDDWEESEGFGGP